MIGRQFYTKDAPLARRIATRLFGVNDVHTHYRLSPLVRYLKSLNIGNRKVTAMELGCGPGLNLLEFARIAPFLTASGFDLNHESIATARAVAERVAPSLNFETKNALELNRSLGSVDYVLLIDFLEHVDNPANIISFSKAHLNSGGKVLVSVPTPAFPLVMGRKIHSELGHIVDGYTLAQLDELMGPSFVRTHTVFNTGLLASVFCFISYRGLTRVRPKRLGGIFNRILSLFSPFDWFSGPGTSISLFAVYEIAGSTPNADY
jgi:2-polyprenyl-3-methyl-5-hydroxy-6-metoxy-1,4-benzoquinol methylase